MMIIYIYIYIYIYIIIYKIIFLMYNYVQEHKQQGHLISLEGTLCFV